VTSAFIRVTSSATATADPEELKAVLVPAVFAELTLDNSRGTRPRRVFFGWQGERLVIHELLITLFVFMTAPISAHLLMKSALELEPLRRPDQPGSDEPRLPPYGIDTAINVPPPGPTDPDARR
jgi:hypothetical protein